MNSELYHHGILGMHWGIRRTPEQLGHYTNPKEYDTDTLKKIAMRDELENKYKKNHKTAFEKDMDSARQYTEASNSGANALRKAGSLFKGKNSNVDLSKYSDKELRDMLNRMNMESQYLSMTRQESKIKKGAEAAASIIEVSGATVATAVGILTLMDKLGMIDKNTTVNAVLETARSIKG